MSIPELIIGLFVLGLLITITAATLVSHNKMFYASKTKLESTLKQTDAFASVVAYIDKSSYVKILNDASGTPTTSA